MRLPFGEGSIGLYALLPDEWDGFVEAVTPGQYQGRIAAMESERVRLAVPKVKLNAAIELTGPLQALGMRRAFDPAQADLSGLFTDTDGIYISRVLQKTFLEMNEAGAEAAAATATMASGSGPPAERVEVVLDRPFLLSIRDDRTGVTLFIGAILEP